LNDLQTADPKAGGLVVLLSLLLFFTRKILFVWIAGLSR
jgi:hypothetical protein